MRRLAALLFLLFLSKPALGLPQSENDTPDAKTKTPSKNVTQGKTGSPDPSSEQIAAKKKLDDERATGQKWAEEQTAKNDNESKEQHIERLIELLVLLDDEAKKLPEIQRLLKSTETVTESPELSKRYYRCQKAFDLLGAYKLDAFPALAAHLDDKRESIHFRNHFKEASVGDACYWNIYFQLQDRPEGYSSYGLKRLGRDGKKHEKPYWEGDPFAEDGL